MAVPPPRALALALLAAAGCAAIQRPDARGTGETALERQLARAAEPAQGPRYTFLGVAMGDRSPAFYGDIRILDRILSHRYGAAYRSVLLSNREQWDQLRDLPLATSENVQLAVEALRAARRPEDRFIVLFTAHGNRGELSEEYPAPGRVRRSVPSALLGRWVKALAPNRTWVMISSCYSGSLLPAIEGPAVLAMTAADADHPSLGCGTLDRSTFFVGALVRSLDFDQSFDELWAATEERLRGYEARYRYPGANPQIRFGADLWGLRVKPLSRF